MKPDCFKREEEITKKDKIIACFGFLTTKSTAKVCNTSPSYVSNVWNNEGLEYNSLTRSYKQTVYRYPKKNKL